MTAIEPKSDAEYANWIGAHPGGFVLHSRVTPDPRYIVLHRALCHLISPAKRGVPPGASTERYHRKICADDLGALRAWLRKHGREDGSFPKVCGTCKPTGD